MLHLVKSQCDQSVKSAPRMPPRKAAAKNSKMSRANASDQESKTKNRVNKRSSKVEIENVVEELPPKKKAKVHNHLHSLCSS